MDHPSGKELLQQRGPRDPLLRNNYFIALRRDSIFSRIVMPFGYHKAQQELLATCLNLRP